LKPHNPPLSEADRVRIAKAVRAAEAATSGEIVCVIARRCDSYLYPAGFLFSALVIPSTFLATLLAHWLWIDLGGRLVAGAALAAWLLGLLALAVFAPLRRLLAPRALQRAAASAAAALQFRAASIHRTKGRTGIMIFVSLNERHVEILADTAIDDQVTQAGWQAIVDRLIAAAAAGRLADGLVAAVEETGAVLARIAPPGRHDHNELPDHVVIL